MIIYSLLFNRNSTLNINIFNVFIQIEILIIYSNKKECLEHSLCEYLIYFISLVGNVWCELENELI